MVTDFDGKSEGRKPHGRPWRTLEDNIKSDLENKDCEAVN